MNKPRGFLSAFNRTFHMVTDWLLIFLGIGLGVVAWRAIDVGFVKYSVMVIGFLLVITGAWSRLRVTRERAGK